MQTYVCLIGPQNFKYVCSINFTISYLRYHYSFDIGERTNLIAYARCIYQLVKLAQARRKHFKGGPAIKRGGLDPSALPLYARAFQRTSQARMY